MSKENKKGGFKSIHWADATADRIIRQCGDKDQYTVASGITPSGVVHFGNFRETITVDFVARALRDRGKKVRFIFSWDDDLKKKAKKISELTKDISEYLDENVKLNFIKNKENTKIYKIAYHSACSMQH